MFSRLNQRCLPEIAAYNRVIDRQQARRNQCREDTDKAQNEGAGDLIEIDLWMMVTAHTTQDGERGREGEARGRGGIGSQNVVVVVVVVVFSH